MVEDRVTPNYDASPLFAVASGVAHGDLADRPEAEGLVEVLAVLLG